MFRLFLRSPSKNEASFTPVERGILFAVTLIFAEQMLLKF
jgi:hypothetical protein